MLKSFDKVQALKDLTTFNCFFYPHSRSHLLKQSFPGTHWFIKREDELGGIFNGSKVRKCYSLLDFLIKHSIKKVVLKGGAYSNFVINLIPLLIEKNIKPVLFLRGEASAKVEGNLFYLNLFKNCCDIHWIDRQQWPTVDQKMQIYKNADNLSDQILILPEGACCKESFPGSLTLAVDIFYNQQQLNVNFDHIFIEAGTGATAIALILGLQYLGSLATVHVLNLTKGNLSFENHFNQFHEYFKSLLPETSNQMNSYNYGVYEPVRLTSFGLVNKTVIRKIQDFAESEGIILDPIYSAPLFIEAPLYIKKHNLKGNFLFIHNGGTLATIGYKQKFL